MTSPATELPTARGLVDTSGSVRPAPPSGVMAYPIVLLVSLALHAGVLAVVMALPVDPFEVATIPMELTIEVEEPAPEPAAAPEPEPEPE
ncbi:MAG: hypothetical protein KC619_06300, partial [Myxococcales bacterium]|nr:hypothetical protein [Myxococcales bacterium]